MTTIITRAGKGSPLTNNEMDANFTNLNNDKLEAGTPATNIAVTPTGGIVATDVQAALAELDTELSGTVTKTASTGAAVIPTGTTANRPGTPVEGHFRRNSELGQWEGYDGSQWSGIGVTSVNGNTGDVTAAQIAAAATAGYGYTPADGANYSPTGHTHSGYASTNMTHGAVGSLCFARLFPTSRGTITLAAGATVAGSQLLPAGGISGGGGSWFVSSGAALAGTWRCLGYAYAVNSSNTAADDRYAYSLFQRIS